MLIDIKVYVLVAADKYVTYGNIQGKCFQTKGCVNARDRVTFGKKFSQLKSYINEILITYTCI